MNAILQTRVSRPIAPARNRRFDRVLITSLFGDPRNPRTWSGVSANLATRFEAFGIGVETRQPRLSRITKLALAAHYQFAGYGKLVNSEQILRCEPARHRHAAQLATAAKQLDCDAVLHTGALDLPPTDIARGVKHYLYCDQTWAQSLRYRPDAPSYSRKARLEFERLERESLAGLAHIFTFAENVRDHIIEHYGVPEERVSAIGSGMGQIEPYDGPKDYTRPALLFVAKHLFKAKGGEVLVAAVHRALERRRDLTLTIVGDERSRRLVKPHPNIVFRDHLPWAELQGLFRSATLLVQPMLNDPWGQVYLEALLSRTPVMGLARNGLPEIVEGGRHGFLVARPDPDELANAIVAALMDPDRLARMGQSGQRRVLNSYSWDRVAEAIAFS
jgi:glycosyltransferase involved in cell wall biosynthesis